MRTIVITIILLFAGSSNLLYGQTIGLGSKLKSDLETLGEVVIKGKCTLINATVKCNELTINSNTILKIRGKVTIECLSINVGTGFKLKAKCPEIIFKRSSITIICPGFSDTNSIEIENGKRLKLVTKSQ